MGFKNTLSIIAVYTFIRELTKPWDKLDAFKLGIIDAEGNLLKKAGDLKTNAEKDAYTLYDRLIWNVKRLLGQLPGGDMKIKNYAAAAWMMKEHKELIINQLLHTVNVNELSEARKIIEDVTAPTNVASGVALKDTPIKLTKKKKDDMEDTEKTSCTLRRKIAEAKELIADGKVLKRVVRQGKTVKKGKCPLGQILKDGRCVPETSQDKRRFVVASKKRKRSMAGKSLNKAMIKRTRSLRKRSSQGLK